ncbi:MAG: hypothetical protein ACI8UO_006633 [Verrucomicrobiales bacterium]|jgi:hypothetical protein
MIPLPVLVIDKLIDGPSQRFLPYQIFRFRHSPLIDLTYLSQSALNSRITPAPVLLRHPDH